MIQLRPKKAYIAALGNLSQDQASRLCGHFKAKSKACQVLGPTYMASLADHDNAYHAALKAKRKAAAKKRKLRRKKKRKSRKKRRKKKRRASAKR